MSKISTTIEMITPKQAAEYLSKNHPKNRPLRAKRVKEWATTLKEGRWVLTHQGIAFDVEDYLIDGQHRLSAIIASGVPAQMMVTRNMSIDSFVVLDQGAYRNSADILRLPHWHVAAIRCLIPCCSETCRRLHASGL